MSRRRRTLDSVLASPEARELGELLEEGSGSASREELSRWADDPVGWDLKADRDPVDYQRVVMESVAVNKRTAWRGCHACGKDFTIGSLAVWGAYARGMLVLVVSATEQQVLKQSMKEVRRAWRAAQKAHGIGGQVYQGSIRVGGEDRIVALTGSANVDALTGWHEPENGVLVLISEGQGERLEEAAYDAAEGNVTTAKGRILAAGNPVRPEGRFYRIHRPSSQWERFRTSAADTPNVKAGKLVRSGFPAPGWPEDVAREYGEESGFYVGRVLAEFPTESDEGLFRREWLEAAAERHESTELASEDASPVAALDPARFGPDASVLVVRRGDVLEEVLAWGGRVDTTDLVDRVEGALTERGFSPSPTADQRRDWRNYGTPEGESLKAVGRVVVDEVGLGAGAADVLKDDRWRVKGYNGGRKASEPDRFFNRRAEAYWRLRKSLEAGEVALPDDEALFEELLAVRWRPDAKGRVQLESKRDLASRMGRSPDRADAVSMCFYPWRRIGAEGEKKKLRVLSVSKGLT